MDEKKMENVVFNSDITEKIAEITGIDFAVMSGLEAVRTMLPISVRKHIASSCDVSLSMVNQVLSGKANNRMVMKLCVHLAISQAQNINDLVKSYGKQLATEYSLEVDAARIAYNEENKKVQAILSQIKAATIDGK